MSNVQYQLYCCGSRGSRPVEGKRFNEFGGFTSCYVLKKGDYALIIDCGTGLYEANSIVLNCTKIDVVLTHIHYDHLMGMLDWASIPARSELTFYGNFEEWFGEKTFEEFFRDPFWPVQPKYELRQCPAEGEKLMLQNDLSVEFYKAPHPDGAKILVIRQQDETEHRMAVMFDCEQSDALPYDILNKSDYIIYDGMYDDKEYPLRQGYGHSTWQEGCRLAERVNCSRLIITHHFPARTDDQLRYMEQLARDMYPQTDFARCGQNWTFPYSGDITDSQPKQAKETKGLRERINDKLTELVLNDDKRARLLSIGCYVILGIVSLFMTAVNIATGKHLLMLSTFVFAIACMLNVMLVTLFSADYKLVQTVFQVEALCLFTFFIVSGTPEGFSALWSLLLPVGGMLLFGKRRTTILSIILLGILIFFFYTAPGRGLLQYQYTESFMLRFPMAFVAFFLTAYFLETIRERTVDELRRLKDNQADIIAVQTSELREKNFDMIRINSKLELTNRLMRENISDEKMNEITKEIEDRDSSNNTIDY